MCSRQEPPEALVPWKKRNSRNTPMLRLHIHSKVEKAATIRAARRTGLRPAWGIIAIVAAYIGAVLILNAAGSIFDRFKRDDI